MKNPLYDQHPDYFIPSNLMEKESTITTKMKGISLPMLSQRAVENMFRVLYFSNYDGKVRHTTINNYKQSGYFNSAEWRMLKRFATYATGKQKALYGVEAVKAMKRDKYTCVFPGCKMRDVRALEIDHKKGRKDDEGNLRPDFSIDDFQTLCANHHKFKTAVEDPRY